jgi:diguanylate cyclase (GGDEF)-like protein
LPFALEGLVSVLLAIAVYGAVNRALVTLALLDMGARGRALLGSRDENLVELATLCLGGLLALAAVYQPWLCVLVVAPMAALQRGALVRELEAAATTDAKTGLLNAVAWEHLAKREMARGLREEYGVGLLIIDVDRFKVVNDRFGHLAGDAVLRGVGKCLEASMREYDGVGRFGGEEFVAVLPNAVEADSMVIAERTRAKINQLRVSDFVEGIPEESDLNLAVSIGVSCMPADGTELAELLHAADGALYRAKAMGRNRVVLADRGAGDPFVRASLN